MSAGVSLGYTLPSAQARRRLLLLGGLAVFLIGAGALLKFEPWLLITDFHHLVRLAGEMTPPNLALLWEKTALYATVGETLGMAFLGTLVGGCIALVLAFFAARNTSPHPLLRGAVRGLFQLERATPNFIVLLVLLVAVGFGPFAGMLALTIGSVGMFGKLFADAIEQVDQGPAEAVTSVGATRSQMIRYAIIPQVLPSVVANWFYAFDVNLRTAIALGIYGGGGIGFELHLAIKVLRYRDVLALVLLIIVLVTLTERVSDFFRRRLLRHETLQ
ncbi:MAG TPA: phosphonate ABC transporter, permease protein PhnE [Opitutaceae bacterium]